MKSSILVCQLDKGELHSVAFPLFSEADEALRKVRKDRTIEIGKKAVSVSVAVIVTQNAGSAQVVKTANVAADARREAMIAKTLKEAKAKAGKTEETEKS
jgi:hypothetical protein